MHSVETPLDPVNAPGTKPPLPSFADSLAAELGKGKERTCAVCIWYRNLDPPHQLAFDQYAAEAPRGYVALMWRAASNSGLQTGYDNFVTHMRMHRGLR